MDESQPQGMQPNLAPGQEQEVPIGAYHNYLDQHIAKINVRKANIEKAVANEWAVVEDFPEQLELQLARYALAGERMDLGDFSMVAAMLTDEIAEQHDSAARTMRSNAEYKAHLGENADPHIIRAFDNQTFQLIAKHQQRANELYPLQYDAFRRYARRRDESGAV